MPETFADLALTGSPSIHNLEGSNIMADDKEALDWFSPRQQRETDNQAAFLRCLLEREEAQVDAAS
ncbi:hypothetical protein [Arthrobacter sp. NPDC057013]|uniref:hypothetical protein n=1 Tax=Arthrobacter sp. NPDC057013 TaxID=3345999 RepID=UPI00364229DE